jgi:hypothetical protein
LNVGMLEADADELHEVLGLEPDREPPVIERGIAEVADAQAGDAQPVLVGIERARRLPDPSIERNSRRFMLGPASHR